MTDAASPLNPEQQQELVGRRRLRSLDPAALELLWRNQLGLMALIVAYCGWSMYRTTVAPDPEMAELTTLLGDGVGDLVQSLTLTMYAAVIVVTVIFQGLNARYYFVRIARVQEFLARTPGWAVDLLRSAGLD